MDNNIEYYRDLVYRVNLKYNREDDTWTAYHPEFGRGSCYAIGDNQTEAIELLNTDRMELIAALLESKMDIPEPQLKEDSATGKVALRIPKTLHSRIREFAITEGVSVNQFIATQLAYCGGQYALMNNVKAELTNLMQNIHIQRVNQLSEFSEYNNVSMPNRYRAYSKAYYTGKGGK